MVAEGTYLAKVLSKSFVSVGRNQTPAINFKFKVIKNIDNDTECNEIMYSDQWITENCYKRTFEMCTKVFGWSGTDIFEDFKPEGKECLLVIEEDEHDGKKYSKIKWINSVDGGSRSNAPFIGGLEKDELRKMFKKEKAQPSLLDDTDDGLLF